MKSIKIECKACGATGLYRGCAEPKGVAVVCCACGGTGCAELEYEPFEQRKERRGVHKVQWSRGTFIATGVGPAGRPISYEEFRGGKLPSKS